MSIRTIIYFLLFLLCSSCAKKVQHFARWDYASLNVDGNVGTDTFVENIILPFRTQLNAKVNESIGYLSSTMEKNRPSSALTNFVADAVFDQYNFDHNDKIDLFISNYGGIRVNSFAQGDITVGDIYEIMPFDNTFVILEVGQNDLLQLLNKIARSEGWPISRGSGFIIKDSVAVDIKINDGDLMEKTYRLGLPDYVANGGDGISFFTKARRIDTGILIRDLMLSYVKRRKNIIPDNTPRIAK